MHSDSVTYESSYDDPTSWVTAVDTLLQRTPISLRSRTLSICVSGTSASCLLVDSQSGLPSRDGGRRAKMYNYDVYNADTAGGKVRQWLDQDQDRNDHGHGHGHGHGQLVPANHVVRSSTSALAKLLHYHASQPIQSFEVLAHQSEYVATTVFMSPTTSTTNTNTGVREYVSDWHNALKLGYDVKTLQYPQWLLQFLQQDDIGIPSSSSSTCTNCGVLPRVVEPGQPIGPVSKEARDMYGFSEDTMVVGGTTDSNASFLAAALGGGSGDSSSSSTTTSTSNHPSFGTAVTSLGSTLAIKMLSRTFVEDCERGVYSHRFPSFVGGGKDGDASADACTTDEPSSSLSSPQLWLVGGASNVGCAVLRQENFTNQELKELSSDMDITIDCELSYYPLTKKGERFPIADGSKEPILEPKPKSGSRQDYLKAILQGISKVERMGYDTLGMLGANPPFPKVIMTTGGGSKNEKWMQMRQRLLQSQDSSSLVSSSSSSPSSLLPSRVVMVGKAENTEASFGAAILAAAQFVSSTSV
mmetsp:Transcript_2507/g.4692  ORF Transcript_2507/g.4692 Transcript_2507/m.4692 type:complete len:528 (+) Transcript_2507:306-1889(+)